MASDGNKMNDMTSYQTSETALCANGCGFFGTAATMNLCSKCFRDLRVKEEQAASAKAAMNKLVNQTVDGLVGPSSSAVVTEAVREAEPVVATAAGVSSEAAVQAVAKPANRCLTCNKKVGVMGFKCKCASTFCGVHRYPEKHECEFDFKGVGKTTIAKANPIIKADKHADRI